MEWKTKVRLYSNVPFSSSYENVRWFASKSEQISYFNNLSHKVATNNGNYAKIEDGEILLSGLKDTNDFYNYMVVENKSTLTNEVRTYYCFINSVAYDSAIGTRFRIEIDVIQTYMFDITFNKSFVERAHMPRWKSNGRPVLNVAPETVNKGSEYRTVRELKFNRSIDDLFEVMIVAVTKSLHYTYPNNQIRTGVMSGVATPLMYYMVLLPKEPQRNKNFKWRVQINNDKYLYNWQSGTGAPYNTGVSNALQIFDAGDDEKYANRIVNIAYLPFFPFNASVDVRNESGGTTYNVNVSSDFVDVQHLVNPSYHALFVKGHAAQRINNAISSNIYDVVKSYYSGLGINESKLLMYPFTVATLYDNLGGAFEIKPQYTNDGAVNVDALTSISSSPKAAYIVKNYLGTSSTSNAIISNVNADIEVLNDHTATYMQGKRNSDSVAMAQAKQTGLLGAGTGLMTAGLGLAAIAAAPVTAPLAIGGLAMGVSGAGGIMSSSLREMQTVDSILAQQEDMKNIPPAITGQVGATNLVLGYELILPRVEIKTLSPENARIVADYFKMYGVAVTQLIDVPLRTRAHYNFVKTVGANITGSVPVMHLAKIKAVFDSGVTLWHTNDMYNYNLSNNER